MSDSGEADISSYLPKAAGDLSLAVVKAETCSGKPWMVGQSRGHPRGTESQRAEAQLGPLDAFSCRWKREHLQGTLAEAKKWVALSRPGGCV